jgi:hypothetical protein
LGVDTPSGITGKFTATILAQQLYANNALNVGNNQILFSNTVGQFSGSDGSFLQVNMQNFDANGSGDFVITGDQGTNYNNYIDLGLNGSNFNLNDTVGTAFMSNDGYLYVSGPEWTPGHPYQGNLIIGTTSSNTKTFFISGGANTENVVGYIDNTGIHFANINNKISANLAIAKVYTDSANTWLQANDATTLAASKSYTDSANTSLKTYSDNKFLANTTGTFGGDLTITGNTIIKTAAAIHNASMTGNNQYLIITGTAGDAISPPSNPGYTFHSAIDGGNRLAVESYGTGSSIYPGLIGRRGRGTAQAPSSVQTNDIILRVGGNAYGTTKFSQFADARIEFVATENHTDAFKGTHIEFWTTVPGTNTATQIAVMNGGSATFTGVVNPQKGFIYTPNVNGTVLTKTLDFSTDSLVKFNVNDNATISLSNFTAGKVIEVWITNSAGQNKTITHGCLANNSTSKQTTFTIQSSSCAYLRYFSIDGDQANTYVSITA